MVRTHAPLEFSSSLEITALAPIDARMLVLNIEDLTADGSFDRAYNGMVVSVASTGKVYILKDKTNITSLVNGWKEVGGGANRVVANATARKTAGNYDNIFQGMMVTQTDTGVVYIYTGSDSAGISSDANWKTVGDDSTDLTNIAQKGFLVDKILSNSWSDDSTNGKIYTSAGLKKYNINSNTWANDASGTNMLEIPYATTSSAGIMSSTDKTTLGTVSTFVSNYAADEAITTTTIDSIVDGTYGQSES